MDGENTLLQIPVEISSYKASKNSQVRHEKSPWIIPQFILILFMDNFCRNYTIVQSKLHLYEENLVYMQKQN